ncbi:hypothetical protein Cni_G24987 [Canna indica]|uniref:Uncharacterized protein n=1 Tax=Canna indica TaxID=4628 RepID=A0AAQ3KX63_9LILI|nr:hypothetical protein Cni_G24987 [Canna indica]
MGNCISHRVATWVDEEEEPASPADHVVGCDDDVEGKATSALMNLKEKSSSSTVVKIRITKKQLEELVQRHYVGEELPVGHHRVLADIMSKGVVVSHELRRPRWRPVLKSIPEVAEEDDVDI